MHNFFGFSMLAALIAVLVSLALLVHAFFRKKTYRARLIFSGIAFALLMLSFIGFGATTSPEERAAVEQKRIAKQAQEAQEKAVKEEKKAQRDAEKKPKEEQSAKAKEQAAADAAAQKVFDDQAEYEKWVKEKGIIGTVPGLGDRIEEFEKKHKRSRGNDPDSYDDNLLSVMKDEGRVLFITVNAFGRPLDPDVIVTPLLPTDGVRISSSDDRSDKYNKRNTFIGHSDILEIVIPKSKGYYTRMDVYDIPTCDYLYTTVFTGNYDDPDTM